MIRGICLVSLYIQVLIAENSPQPKKQSLLPFILRSNGKEPNFIPNIESALLGYDPVKGDSFAFPNPGFKNQIFNPWQMTQNGTTVLRSFISAAHSNYNCKQDFRSTTVKNYGEYAQQKSASHSFSIGADASASGGFSIFSFHASAGYSHDENSEAKKSQKFFQETNGEISISTSQCISHTIKISSFVPPEFTDSFKQGVLKMYEEATDWDSEYKKSRRRHGSHDERKREVSTNSSFVKFVNDFGTHYLKSVHLGTKIIFQKKFSKKSRSSAHENSRNKCVSNAAHASVGGGVGGFFSADASFSTNSQDCGGESDSEKSGSEDESQSESVTTIGTLLTSNENALFNDVIQSVPISFELDKISSLFTDEWLSFLQGPHTKSARRYRRKAGILREFFEKKTSDYCRLMLGQKCKLDNKGCGLNSLCSHKEICVDNPKHPLGHQCLPNYGELI